ncbi:MAG: hypothetical protein ABJN38_00055 [Lentilitoribacter sp.]
MPRQTRIGTYNVENLLDRFDDPYSVGDDLYGRFRSTPKSRAHSFDVANRIRENGIGGTAIVILGLQEVENSGALLDFMQASVWPEYGAQTGVASQPSNDPRGIDLGLLCSKDFSVGRVVSQ